MDAPTLEEARSRSELLAARYPDPAGDDELTELLLDAGEIVASLTCRLIEPATTGEEVPAGKIRTAIRAVVMKAEKMAVGERSTGRKRERAIGKENLRSITAGPWSESYFGPEEAAKAKMLDPSAVLNEALWSLATEDCRAAWLAQWTGQQPPAAAPTEIDYTSRGRY